MPQDYPRTETQPTQQMRGKNVAAAKMFNLQFGDMGKRSIHAGLRMQTEIFDALQTISLDWVRSTTTETELALNLPNRLAGAHSIPEAMTAYQEWLSEWLTRCNEDGSRLVADGQNFTTTGIRCFSSISPGARN